MRRSLLVLAALSSLAACGGDDAPAAPAPAPTESTPEARIDPDAPTECVPCHAAVVEEWRTSMHASAHHEADPIYGGMRRLRMGREGDELAGRCAQCHGPRAPMDPDGAVARAGVACASCHAIAALDREDGARRGAGAITWAEDGTLRGPHDVEPGDAPHGAGPAAPWITDGRTLCLTCHDAMQNPQGVATCTTGTEHAEAGGEQTCVGCHMPEIEAPSGAGTTRRRHRSHAFLGPHHLWREGDEGRTFMASALDASAALADGGLRLTLTNRAAHSVPSGFPGRVVLALAVGFDDAGEEVWRSFREDPMREDPDAVLNKVYVDAEGAPTMPPYAVRMARDTRLRPGETRTLDWRVPEGVARAEVRLLYRLLPPPAAQAIGVADQPIASPRPFLTVRTP